VAATGTPALKIDSSQKNMGKKYEKKSKAKKTWHVLPQEQSKSTFSIVHHSSMIVAMIMMPPPILPPHYRCCCRAIDVAAVQLPLLLPLMMMNISPMQCLRVCYDFDLLLLFIVPNAMMATGCRASCRRCGCLSSQ